MPAEYAALLPALRPVNGTVSVSPRVTVTSDTGTPSSSDVICASTVCSPVMSTWPVISVTEPSAAMVIKALV